LKLFTGVGQLSAIFTRSIQYGHTKIR
jgi:hypothetical protein